MYDNLCTLTIAVVFINVNSKVLVFRNKMAFLRLYLIGSTTVEVQPVYEIHNCPDRHV